MPDVEPWLSSLPTLTARMREEVSAAYRQGLMQSALPVFLVDLDGRLLAMNAEAEQTSGYDEADLHGQLLQQLLHEDDRDMADRVLERLAAGQTRREDFEARWTRRDGRVGWSRLHVFRVDDEVDGQGRLVGLVEDITDERFAQRQAAALVETGRLISDGAPLSVVAEELAAVAEDRWSGVGCSLTVLDDSGQELVPVAHGRLPDDFVAQLPPIPPTHDGAACGNAVREDARVTIADLRRDPRARRFAALAESYGIVSGWAVPVRDPRGHTVGALGLFHRFSAEPTPQDWQVMEVLAGIAGIAVFVDADRRRQQAEQEGLRHDQLTRLPNTVALFDELAGCCGSGEPLTLAVVRLHDIGDLSTVLGDDAATHVVCRLADRAAALGDVRAVALVGPMTLAIAASVAWNDHHGLLIQRILGRPLQIGALTVRPRLKVGLSVKPVGQSVAPETLLRQATVAVPAKGVATYDPGVAHRHVALYALAAEVGRALRGGEMVVHYQPQYDLADGRPLACEALVRWEHPERGLLFPGAFLPAVERAAAGPDLALYVVRRVLADAEERRRRGLIGKVAVNLTAEDVRQEHLLDFLCDPDEARWRHLEVELTENSLADPHCLAALERLARSGYSVALDDFGTGYSSLSALHRMPLKAVKVDRSFVQRLPGDAAADALVGAVAAMCSKLGLRVVAEGIETPEQAAAVRRLGCGTGQGFLLRRPAPLQDHDGAWAKVPPLQ